MNMHAHTTRPQRNALRFVVAYGLCFFVQAVGGYYTTLSVGDWYPTLNKSPLTPPGAVFGITWTVLYFLMALAAARIAKITGQWNNRPLRWWFIQLFAGLLWTMVFFGQRNPDQGLYIISFGWVATLITLIYFWRVNRTAGLLLLPLMAWISFASYLNGYIVTHN
ncbi:MAG: TspO protein [Azospirillum brasilense]|nr:MAG: TspO protein [Azospirillum brasilense]